MLHMICGSCFSESVCFPFGAGAAAASEVHLPSSVYNIHHQWWENCGTQEDLLLCLLQLQHLFDCCESDILRLELPGSWFFFSMAGYKKNDTLLCLGRLTDNLQDDDDDDVLVRMLSTRSSSISADLSQWINSFVVVVVVVVVATFLQDSCFCCCCHPLSAATCPSHLGSISLHSCPWSGCWVLLPCPSCKQQWVAAC